MSLLDASRESKREAPCLEQSASAHLREIRTGAIAGLFLKGAAFGGSFLLSVAVARVLGVAGSGLFFLSLTLVTVLSTLARVGTDKPLVRFVAQHAYAGGKSETRDMVSYCATLVAVVSAITTGLVWAASGWASRKIFAMPELEVSLDAMVWAIPALAVGGVIAFAYQGLSKIAVHLLLLSVLAPALTLVAVVAGIAPSARLSVEAIYASASVATAIFALVLWGKSWGFTHHWPEKNQRFRMVASSHSTFVVTAAQMLIVWAPNILLAAFADSAAVARFHAASRTALLVGFVLIAVNGIAAPKFAVLFSSGDRLVLERTVRHTTRIVTMAALPLALLFVMWPRSVLGLFGEDFEDASALLRILAVGQFIGAATGSVGNLLLMTGHERDFRNICLFGAALCVAVCLLTIPRFGAAGAAWAATTSVVVINVLSVFAAQKRVGFSGLAFISRAGD